MKRGDVRKDIWSEEIFRDTFWRAEKSRKEIGIKDMWPEERWNSEILRNECE